MAVEDRRGHITLQGLAMKTHVMAVGDRLGLHCLAWVGYEALCDGHKGQGLAMRPCVMAAGAGWGHITLRGLAMKTCVVAAWGRMGSHYLAGISKA